ncbi:hypothetical protein E1091_00120 [Micromonospora fluostatini]|uniref:DUF222 domain-containing protein n=1 Tax=Micromonospora fluostatini TaxID=1629071 RepID=A0ABY2DM67_9ACTN|nr:hypothetical protein E1091_00120 [Micromonospora fluostatini]
MSTVGYEVEPYEVEAAVSAAIGADLEAAGELGDPLARYHELTRLQRLWEEAAPRIARAIKAERGAALAATGLRHQDLVEPTGLGTRQRVQQVTAAAARRDPVALAAAGQEAGR